MRCSTCGETLTDADVQCPTCGAAVLRNRGGAELPSCPRCGYSGQGVRYFKRPAHMGLLVGAGLISYGIGSLIYWMMRKNSVVCPNCGLRWDWSGMTRQIAPPSPSALDRKRVQAYHREEPLPRNGIVRRVGGTLIALMFPIRKQDGEGPPYGVEEHEIVGVLGAGLELVHLETPASSVRPRLGRERLAIFRK